MRLGSSQLPKPENIISVPNNLFAFVSTRSALDLYKMTSGSALEAPVALVTAPQIIPVILAAATSPFLAVAITIS